MSRTVAANYQDKAGLILDAAARVFAERGYARATMTAIARGAGFSKASAYHYFTAKQDVLYALLRRSLDELIGCVERADPGPTVPPQVRTRILFEAYCAVYVARVSVVTPLLLDLGQLDGERRDELHRLEHRLLNLLAEAIADLGSGLPPRVAALLLFGAANWTYYWYDPSGPIAPQALAQAAAAFLMGDGAASGQPHAKTPE